VTRNIQNGYGLLRVRAASNLSNSASADDLSPPASHQPLIGVQLRAESAGDVEHLTQCTAPPKP
jgi:hypothetical protein